jgi:hypothetical protein
VLALALDGPQLDLSVPLVERCAIPFDARGRILVRHLARTSYLVTARFADGSTRTARVELPSDGPLDLSPLPCGEIEVVVRDAAGRRVRGCGVAIATWLGDGEIPADVEGHDEWFEWRSGATDRTGRFCARGVRAGRVRVRASGTDTEPLLERTLEARFVLVEDEHRTIDMTLPPPQDGGR